MIRSHTHYSVQNGLLDIDSLVDFAKSQDLPAVAITDLNNLFGVVQFVKACKGKKIKPVVGVDLMFSFEEKEGIITLLVKDAVGYKNLCYLITTYQKNKKITLENLGANKQGLIAISGFDGLLGQTWEIGKDDLFISNLIDSTEEFYVGISRQGFENEEQFTKSMIEKNNHIPMVINNLALFKNSEDYITHEVRVCIANAELVNDINRSSPYNSNQFQRPLSQLQQDFADISEIIENTKNILLKCNFHLPLGKTIFPVIPADRLENKTSREYMSALIEKGLETRGISLEDKQSYIERVRFEEEMIATMGFVDYYLVVWEFVNWARNNGVAVGPGRGSGAGSLVAYLIGITDVDPMKYGLLFERFLNPERVSLPDFDIDFCVNGRDRVISHVKEIYGENTTSQIITFGTFGAKGAVRDVVRALGKPYGLGDRIAKMIPNVLNITLTDALKDKEFKKLVDESEEISDIIDITIKLEGMVRNVGTHAGGVVIGDKSLLEYCPFYFDDEGNALTQLDMKDCESIGLIKFDFLGLKSITIVQNTLKTIGKSVRDIDINDSVVYEFFQQADTLGLFQLESQGATDLLKRIKPTEFEDIAAIIALYRPGPLGSGMVDDFVNGKHGADGTSYLHARLETILKPTHGVMVYQEQVMQVAQELAGYSLGEADILRRAMGKKQKDVMEQEQEKFCLRASQRGVDSNKAREIFQLVLKFADYGFNKSHSIAYAMVVYYTAWLKTYYFNDFFVENLNSDIHDQDRVLAFITGFKERGIELVYPSVNIGDYHFKVNDGKLIYGLGAIKGVGQGMIEQLCQIRRDGGAFTSFADFMYRAGGLGKKALEGLIKAGALDEFGINVGVMLEAVEGFAGMAKNDTGNSLFGDEPTTELDISKYKEISNEQKLFFENEVLGLYRSGDPLKPLFQAFGTKVMDLEGFFTAEFDKDIKILAYIDSIKKRKSKNNRDILILTLKDTKHKLEVLMFINIDKFLPKLRDNDLLVIEAKVVKDDFKKDNKRSLDIRGLLTPQEFIEKNFTKIGVDISKISEVNIAKLPKILTKNNTGLPLLFRTELGKYQAKNRYQVDRATLLALGEIEGIKVSLF